MVRRIIARPRSALRDFLRSEAAGGVLLIAAAVVALFVANSPLGPAYFHWLHMETGPVLAPKLGPMTVHLWINDGLMALFFFVVGLEVKREFLDGHLARWSDRRLPFIAATTGMIVPALIYLAVVRDDAGLPRGWAVPVATDIAFALGLLALLGKRAPVSLKLLLTTVATVDDVGAVLIIALFYTNGLDTMSLAGAGVTLAALAVTNRAGATHPALYLAGFAVLWVFVLRSGVHATVAGVLAAMVVPIRSSPGVPDYKPSTLDRLEHGLNPWVAFGVVPLFGFANAGVSLHGMGIAQVFAPLPLAIALGLFVGKQLGVFGGIWLAVRLRLAQRPTRTSWAQIYGVSLLCGIGFTMSLFIGGLAFTGPPEADMVKIGVLLGSVLSAVAGVLVLLANSSGQHNTSTR